MEHFTRASSKEFTNAASRSPRSDPARWTRRSFFQAEGVDAVAYHKSAAALSKFTPTGLTHIEDIVPWIRFPATDGWWMTGRTILVNGGYTTK
jgi:NAD(P)-dependent dehydrogenase (short-subunit alcohol dehydrogenase family)